MSPASPSESPSKPVERDLARLGLAIGSRLREERLARRLTVRDVAARARLTAAAIYAVENGRPASMGTYVRLCSALGLTLQLVTAHQNRSVGRVSAERDFVHAAMAELEVVRLSGHGYETGVDEPFQHYQFAGRADVLAWNSSARALLHIENRTRFPDVQQVAGSWNAKRAYLADTFGRRLGIRWSAVTHVMLALWSAEVLHVLRLRTATFRALCPDPPSDFVAWWNGASPSRAASATFVLFDPAATGRQRLFCSLDEALTVRPRHRGYAQAADTLRVNVRRS